MGARIKRRAAAFAAAALLASALGASAGAAFWPFSRALRPDPLGKAESFAKRKAYPETIEAASRALEGSLSKREMARAYWLMGKSYEAMGRLDKALSIYQLAVRIVPKDAGLLLSLGDLYRRVDLDERAQPEYQAVLEAHPENVAAHLGLGELGLEQGLFDDALGHFLAVIAVHPKDSDALLGQARALEGLGRLEQAEAALRQVSEVGADGAYWVVLAEIQKRRGDLSDALASLGRAIAVAPDRDDLVLRRLFWLLDAGRAAQAAEGARSFLANNPDDPLAHFALAMALLKSGDTGGARRELSASSGAASEQGGDPFLQTAARALLQQLDGGGR